MNFAIIASEKDEAGKNTFRHIHEDFPMLNHYLIKEESINAENIDRKIQADFFIFASKHQSKEARKTFSVHAPGNWNKAEFGGKEGKICRTSSFFLKYLLQILNQEVKNANSDYEVTLEVTHHGPYLEKPCCFIEIGTTKEEWKDEKAGKLIAETINKAIKTFNPEKLKQKWKAAIGIGSKHYCPNFNKIQLNSEYALSHIIPQYTLPITEEMIKQAVKKTEEKVELAILDWKAMKSGERQEAIKILEKLNLNYKKTSEISRETE